MTGFRSFFLNLTFANCTWIRNAPLSFETILIHLGHIRYNLHHTYPKEIPQGVFDHHRYTSERHHRKASHSIKT